MLASVGDKKGLVGFPVSEFTGRITIESLPPDNQASEAHEDENTPDDRLPLVCRLLHLWVGLAEHQPVHWEQQRAGQMSPLGRLLVYMWSF